MPKIKHGQIAAQVAGKKGREVSRIKAKAIVQAVKARKLKPQSLGAATLGGESATPDASYTLDNGGRTYTVDVRSLQDDDNGALLCILNVSGPAGPVAFSNPLIVVNPPVIAPDPNGEEGDMIEDPATAFEVIVLQAVQAQL